MAAFGCWDGQSRSVRPRRLDRRRRPRPRDHRHRPVARRRRTPARLNTRAATRAAPTSLTSHPRVRCRRPTWLPASRRSDVTACANLSCTSEAALASNNRISVTTEEEAWQLQASGDSIEQATRIVADGNVKIHATRFGPEAPPEVRGRVQIYYGPLTQATKGLAVGVSHGTASSDPTSVLNFTSLAGQSGLISPEVDAPLVADVATGQAVPLASGVIRLFFEALGADGRTRIMHIPMATSLPSPPWRCC